VPAVLCLQTEPVSSSVVSEIRKRNVDPLGDPDYILMVRVEDLAGASENALSSITRVHIVVEQNLWVNPGLITVKEQGEGPYPMVIAKVGAGWAHTQTTWTKDKACI